MATLDPGKTYTARVTVTNQSTLAGQPAAATLTLNLVATVDTTNLGGGRIALAFGPGQTLSQDFPLSVPLATEGETGQALAQVMDPSGNVLAQASEPLRISIPGGITFTISGTNFPAGVEQWGARWSWAGGQQDSAFRPISQLHTFTGVPQQGSLTLWFFPSVDPFYNNSVPFVGPFQPSLLPPADLGSYLLDLTPEIRILPGGAVGWVAGITQMRMIYTRGGVQEARSIIGQFNSVMGLVERAFTYPVTWTQLSIWNFWPSSFTAKYFVRQLSSGGTPGQPDYFEVWWTIDKTYTPISGIFYIPDEDGKQETFR